MEGKSMSKANKGDNVKVHYTGTLDDGTVFDSSQGRSPLEFELGANQVIPGFDQAVEGMEPGEKKKINIPSAEAYGAVREDLIVEVESSMFPDSVKPEAGQDLQIPQPGGQAIRVRVLEVTETHVKLDANHPLAGKDLTFDLEFVEVA